MSQEKLSFNTTFKPCKPKYRDCHSSIIKDYKLVVLKSGCESLVESGSHDIQPILQACAKDNDIYALLARFNAGDESALSGAANKAYYGDITGIDKDLNTLNSERMQLFRQLSSDKVFSSYYSQNASKFDKFDDFLDSYSKFVDKQKESIASKEENNNNGK